VPQWLIDLRVAHKVQQPMIQSLARDQTTIAVNSPKTIDIEDDDSELSAFGLVKHHIQTDLNLANTAQDTKIYVRALLRKTGVKLPRYCGCFYLLHQSILWCHEILDTVNFVAGLHMSDQEIGQDFVAAAQQLVKSKVNNMPKTSIGRPIMQIGKAIVIAANKLYQFTKASSMDLFSTENIDRFVAERLVRGSSIKETARKMCNEKSVLVFFHQVVDVLCLAERRKSQREEKNYSTQLFERVRKCSSMGVRLRHVTIRLQLAARLNTEDAREKERHEEGEECTHRIKDRTNTN
jgi:hypothetical protein